MAKALPYVHLLDKIVSRLIEGLAGKYKASHLYIVGGSSRSIIRTGLKGRCLAMRDLDVAVLGIEPRQDIITRVAESLNLGKVSDFRPRPRGNINAGYGIYCNHPNFGVIDLIFFYKHSFLVKMNGVLTVDNILIRIYPESLPGMNAISRLLERLRKEGIKRLITEGVIKDPYNGIGDFLTRRLRVAHGISFFKSDTEKANVIIRGIKSAAAWHVRMDDPIIKRFVSSPDPNFRRACLDSSRTRNLSRMLTFPKIVLPVIKEMRRLNAVPLFIPELQRVTQSEELWRKMVDDLRCAVQKIKPGVRKYSCIELLDVIKSHMSSTEWLSFAKRLAPVMGEKAAQRWGLK